MKEHEKTVTDFSFSPDGKRIVTVAENNKGKIWDVESCKEKDTLTISLDDPISKLAFSPDGNRIIILTDWMIGVWDAETGRPIRFGPSGHTDRVTDLAFSFNGHYFASASYDGNVSLWDAGSGYLLNSSIRHGAGISAIAFNKDGSHIATAGRDNMAKVWEVRSGKELLAFKGHKDWVNKVAYSRDGKLISTASGDNTIKIWDTKSGQKLLSLPEQESPIKAVDFSPDSKRVATAGLDDTARIWDAASGKALLILDHPDDVWDVAFSPDGKQVATACRNGEVKLWDAASGREIRPLTGGHNGWVVGIAYSHDGALIASASTDKTVRIWDVQTGKQLHNFAKHPSMLTEVSFSPDGKHLAVSGADGMARVYALDTEELLTLGFARVNQSLSSEDCEKYLNQKPCPPAILAIDKIIEGKSLAVEGDLDGALKNLKEARRLDPNVPSGLEKEFKQLSAPYFFIKGMKLSKKAKLKEDIAHFQTARTRDPRLNVRADYWNILCWWSSLAGKASEAIPMCDKAVELSHGYGMYRDTRGVAKTLTGNTKGAIEDFEAYLAQSYEDPRIEQLKPKRRQWLEALRKDKNPITQAEIKELLKEGN
jgi:WD40 repeat protein